ncbi:hypothetical protein DL764_007032 [Monosporascus ibericus]|uniref:NodB homology domain-containing protein n=1 Tax=Monosporascus ibericus TaxID=155417 RepID=A0A4Q4T5G6_9PEZI|nr:hypothetical protein DL764_007032 [Monosporascus ibericus]
MSKEGLMRRNNSQVPRPALGNVPTASIYGPARQRCKATFFATGLNRGCDPNRDRIDDCHGPHANLEALTAEGRRDEILRNEDAFAWVLGFFPTYLRPCFARCIAGIGQVGYYVTNYEVDTKDYTGDYECARAVFRASVASESPQCSLHIVLAHDVWEGTGYGFEGFMINEARRAGYQLITMGESLDDPVVIWNRDASTGQARRG